MPRYGKRIFEASLIQFFASWDLHYVATSCTCLIGQTIVDPSLGGATKRSKSSPSSSMCNSLRFGDRPLYGKLMLVSLEVSPYTLVMVDPTFCQWDVQASYWVPCLLHGSHLLRLTPCHHIKCNTLLCVSCPLWQVGKCPTPQVLGKG